MRYTTIIDITQAPELYRNQNVRLVYLHLVLKAGYHDYDRDVIRCSIRTLAADTGLTVSAVRHAIKILTKWQMIKQHGSVYQVRKFVTEQPITTRAKTAKQQQQLEKEAAAARERREREHQAELERIKREQLESDGLSSYERYMKILKEKAAAGDVESQELLKQRGM